MEELKSFPLDYYRNYLDVDDCSSIYRHCNGRQFEAATKLDLCEFLNLRSPLVPVKVLDGEKQRMCYLINRLLKHRLPAIGQMKSHGSGKSFPRAGSASPITGRITTTWMKRAVRKPTRSSLGR